MKKNAKVVIIGAGIQGLSVAAHLALEEITDVIVLEMGQLVGGGETARTASMLMFQVHEGQEAKAHLSLLSIPEYRKFNETFPDSNIDIGLRQCGSILYATNEAAARKLREQGAAQNEKGILTETLTSVELKKRLPILNVSDIIAAIYCPDDGYLDVSAVISGYKNYAKKQGVDIATGVTAIGILLKEDQVIGVQTTKGLIKTPFVVNAAGALADKVGNWVNLKIPLSNTVRSIWVTEEIPNLGTVPILEDISSEWYLRPEGKQLLVGVGPVDQTTEEIRNLHQDIPARHRDDCREFILYRVPGLANVEFIKGWAGIRPLTPDQLPIIGPVPEVKGFINCCGWSGHGIAHAPVAGRLVAELITHGKTDTLDITPFLLSRFKTYQYSEYGHAAIPKNSDQ